jgi:hypothetical protein
VAILSGSLAALGWLQQEPRASVTPADAREFLRS